MAENTSNIIVQKFGGTSVGTVERIENVADRVSKTVAQGHQVIVVVSAMAGETNRLLGLGQQISSDPDQRELDALVSTGEQVTAALLSIALVKRGVPAQSMLGHQVRIRTDSVFTKARIRSIDASKVVELLGQGKVAVVAGFQGVDEKGDITTLGRGGSDTTAVAVAAAVKASVCEIYTDVDGVYTTDPNVCPKAKKIPRISYEEMLELASLGAKVLQIRSVEVAMKYQVPVHVRSSFSDTPGTWVVGEDQSLESAMVRGVACDKNETKLTIRSVPDQPGVVARVFETLANSAISVDMIIQNVSEKGLTDITFTVTKSDASKAEKIAGQVAKELSANEHILRDDNVAKVSVVGSGMRTHAGVAAKMFRLLAETKINIMAISTSEIKVSCLIHIDHADDAVKALHAGFALDT